ncbi:MAG: SWIM zinc finger family protein [Terriglobia bacterium]
MYSDWGWRPYVSVAERRRKAAREMEKLRKKGHPVSPVIIEGRAITKTFWGKAWCDNLEGYSDYANRLPRGRTYVRNGSVADLQIGPREVKALVSGSHLYKVAINITPVPKARWKSICTDCAGGIDSLVELLQGRFSKGVMERLCRQKTGLFPSPAQIKLSCSCPDWASMCKHVAAVLYGIGARLDQQPELLFKLNELDENDLIVNAGRGVTLAAKAPGAEKTLNRDDLSAIFGLELAQIPDSAAALPVQVAKRGRAKMLVPKKKKALPASDNAAPPVNGKVRQRRVNRTDRRRPAGSNRVPAERARPSAG